MPKFIAQTSFLKKRINIKPNLLPLIIFLLIGLSAIFGQHYFRNLEPYPDGLVYLVPAVNLIKTGKFLLFNQDQILKPNVPPLYGLILAPANLLFKPVAAFYITNWLLATIGLILIYQISLHITHQKKFGFIASLIWISQPWLYFLITLPMSENLSLFLTILAIYLISLWHFNAHKFTPIISFSWLLTGIALIFTKYNLTFMGLGLMTFSLWWQIKNKHWHQLIGQILILLVSGGIYLLYHVWIGKNILTTFTNYFSTSSTSLASDYPPVFFSTAFILPNLIFYSQSLLGFNQNFLWQKLFLTNLILTILSFWGFNKLFQNQKKLFWPLMLISLLTLPMIIIFYVADQRYLVTLTPILLISAIYALCQLRPKWQLTIVYLIFTSQLFYWPQFKFIISANIWHRTQAWQYQAVRHFNQFFTDKPNSYLITALPPFYLKLFDQNNLKLLPLSGSQEYANKQQPIWGEKINYQNLVFSYRQMLNQGQQLYITNAYVTHQQNVINDFENLKQSFKLQLISQGCQQTCNIYLLTNEVKN